MSTAINPTAPPHRQLWALLTCAEHPLRIPRGDTYQYELYRLDPDAVHELLQAGYLRVIDGHLANTETYGKTTQHDGTPCPRTRAAQNLFGGYEPSQAHLRPHPQTLDHDDRELLEQVWEQGNLPRPENSSQYVAEMRLYQRALLEPEPRHPGRVRVSAAGLLALGPGHHPPYGGLAAMCAAARRYNGPHWGPNRHYAYSTLCAPPGAPATTWRRDINEAMDLLGELDALDERFHAERQALRQRERAVYEGIPDHLNYNRPEATDEQA